MVKMADIAERTGLSLSTVSRVLNNVPHQRISTETRDMVLHVARELNYRPNTIAKALQAKKTFQFGLVIPGTTSFMADIIAGLQKVAMSVDYSCLLYVTEGSVTLERHVFESLVARRVDGVIWVPVTTQVYEETSVVGDIPLVQLLNPVPVGCKSVYVHVDQHAGAYMATEYLIRLGHKRIFHFTTTDGYGMERLTGFKDALRTYNIELDPDSIIKCDYSWEKAREMALSIFARSQPPTAIVAESDLSAWGILRAANEYGLKVPDDLSITGFDDSMLSRYTEAPLTTIAQPKRELGQLAMQVLIKQINGETVDNILIRPEIVVRASTAPPPA